MRLHRISLRHFRGVTERELAFDTSGVTVIVGDNETGKSSLLEALALLFELPDDSKAAKVRAVQPVGRDVGTEVAAEVSFGDVRLHYRKQWFRQRATELRVEPDDRALTGREAHDEAARLFGEHVDRTLWAALSVGQEDSLAVPVAGWVTAVLTALDDVAGGEVDHGAAVPLVGAVEAEFLRYFTPTGRPTGEYAHVLDDRDRARVAVADAEAKLGEVEQDVERAERLGRDREVLASRLTEQAARVGELESRRHSASELIGRVERLRRDADLARERRIAARGELSRRHQLRHDAAKREETAAAAVEVARQAGGVLRTAENELDQRTAALRTAREDLANRRATVRRFEADLARLRDRADLAALEGRLAEVEAARADERRLASQLAQATIDDGVLEAAEAAHRDVLTARAALHAGSPKLVVERLGAGEVEVGGDPFTDPTVDVVVERDTTVAVRGIVEVTVRPGAGAAELAAACADAEHHERDLLADLGVSDITDVRRAARARAESAQALAAARDALARRLDGASADDLIADRDLLRARLDAAVAGQDDGGAAPDADGSAAESSDELRAALVRAQEAEAAGARDLAEVEEREAQARKQYETASGEATAARVRAEQELERRDDLHAAVAAARETASDDDLSAAVAEVESEFAVLAGQLAQAEDALAASGVDRLEERLVEAAALRGQLASQVDDLAGQLRRVEGRLEMAGVQGLASAVERAHAELAHAETRAEAVERRALAASRLRETLVRHRTEARRRYSAPLRERIETLGRVVYGPSFGIALGDDLEVRTRTRDGVTVPVSSLSTGAREQLATVVRLAIAGLTATDGSGVPVVLDDALGWSDPTRLEAMGSLLARAGESNQVILLTCVPDRYAGTVAGARIVRVDDT
ncbi:AAA family ATPase [Actinopolymorpha sp. B9G3]|uniref:ATP-binding protein n=1 Tax=Actinopolymorpha sp. B9G3 TaxID=3158970 RepID=UPI0032D9553D